MAFDHPSPPMEPQIVHQAVHSIKWAALAQLLPRLVTPITTMLLALLLVPDDFGVVAIATLVISLANIVTGMGFGATVVQRRTMVDETANMAFWMSLGLAILMYGVLWLLSPAIALFYRIAPLTNVLRIVGVSLIISVFSTIPTALLQKELKFRKIFLIGAGPQIINGVVSLVFAYLKYGYWSLVIGNLTGILCGSILAWVLCRWKPKLIWRTEIAKSILKFSFWILLSNFSSWFFLYADNALAGYYFGSRGLGQYSLGFNISVLLPGMIVSSIALIAYPIFCKFSDHLEVGKELLRFQSLAAALVFPACLGLSAIIVPVVSIIYGIKWPELGMIIQVLSLLPGAVNIWSLNADAFRAIGHPEVWTQVSMAGLVILLPVLFLAGKFGLGEFVLARFLGSLAIPVLCVLVSKKLLSLSIQDQLRSMAAPFLSSIVLLVFVISINHFLSPYQGSAGLVQLLIVFALGGALYLMTLRLVSRKLFDQLFRLGREAIYARG